MRTGVIAISLACSLALTAAPEQLQKNGTLEFQQVSFKRSARPKNGRLRREFTGGPGSTDPTHLVIKGYALFDLIKKAYNIGYFEISHDTLPHDQNYGLFIPFDITAKVSLEAPLKHNFRKCYEICWRACSD